MVKRFTSTVAGASIFISITGLLSKGLGFFREVIFAGFFGLQPEFDIYLVGAVLPLTLNVIVYYLSQNYLIPAVNNIKNKDRQNIREFVGLNFYLFIAGGLLLALILFLISGWIIDLYLHQANELVRSKTLLIFRLFLISIPINCAISILSAYFHYKLEFRFPAYSQLLLNFIFIIIIISLINNLGINVIPVGYILSSVFQLIFLIVNSDLNYRLYGLRIFRDRIKEFMPKTMIIIILIEAVGQLYLLVDRYFFNYVPSGGIAALNYAQIIFHLPISIVSLALATVLFPRFSHFISNKLFKELNKSLKDSIRISAVLFVPVTFIFIYFGDLVIRLVFERGSFSSTDTITTNEALFYFSISLVFYAVYGVLNKMLYSLQLSKKLLYVTIIGIFLKVALNFLLVQDLGQNGLALSTSVSYVFFFFASLLILKKSLPELNMKNIFGEIIYIIAICYLSVILVRYITLMHLGPFQMQILQMFLFVIIFSVNLVVLRHSSVQIFYNAFRGIRGNNFQ